MNHDLSTPAPTPATGYPAVATQPSFPSIEREVLAFWEGDRTFEASVAAPRRRRRVRVLRRPAVRERSAALRSPAHRVREGRRAALPHDARPEGRSALRVGLPRPARRDGGREGARRQRAPGDHRVRHRQVQRRLPHERAPLHRRLAPLRHPSGPLGRLRARLQDPRPPVHGERHVGLQDLVGQGSDLRGLPRAGVLLAVRDAAQQHRDAHGRRVPRPPGPGAHRAVPARLGREDPRLDHHAVDPAEQPRARGRSRDRLRRDGAGRPALHPRRVAPRRLRARARRCRAGGHPHRCRSRRSSLHAAVPVLRRHAERVPRPRRRLRQHRGRHRCGAHGARLR